MPVEKPAGMIMSSGALFRALFLQELSGAFIIREFLLIVRGKLGKKKGLYQREVLC
jgi:hypothetical protein